MRARSMDAFIESDGRAAQCFKRHRACHVRHTRQILGAMKCETTDGSHSLRAVQKRETFFSFQLDRLNASAIERINARHPLALVERFALTDDGQRQMREWRKIAARADGAFLWNQRIHAALKHGNESLDNQRPRAAITQCQHVSAQEQHRARLHFRKRRPNAARMTAHEIKLQLAQLRRRDGEVREFAKARVDAVNDAPRLRNLFNHTPRLSHTLTRFSGERNTLYAARDINNLFERKSLTGKRKHKQWSVVSGQWSVKDKS